jgi:hypothetical protein
VRLTLRNDTTGTEAVGPVFSPPLLDAMFLGYTFALPVNAGENTLVLRVTGTMVPLFLVTQADLTALFVASP